MKTLQGLSVVLILCGGLLAQNRSGFVRTGPIVRSYPGVNFPGGSSALPGIQQSVGGVVFPGGGTQIGVPGIRYNPGNVYSNGGRPVNGGHRNGYNGGNAFGGGYGRGNGYGNSGVGSGYAYPVAVPVFVGGYGNGYDDASAYQATVPPMQAPVPAAQAPPNVIIIYPQGPPAYGMPAGQPQAMVPPQQTEPAQTSAAPADSGETPTHYLIALKDHSIYSAVAYWVDGDTLHYFTTGSNHNEVSLSLVDRDLTRSLNDQSGLQLSLPPAK